MTTHLDLDLAGYQALLGRVFDGQVTTWTAEAEAAERFPRELIEHLGAHGVFRGKWGPAEGGQHPDVARLNALAFALGRLGSAGIGVGVSLHDSAIAILRRFGRSAHLQRICEQAIDGEAVLCIGASEESGGSDLQIVETEVRSEREGFAIRGIKKFVSLSPIADHIMVVARSVDADPASRHGNVLVIAVPTTQVDVQTPWRKVGAGPLDTAAVHIDTWVPPIIWSRGRAPGSPRSRGGWPTNACRSRGRWRRRVSGYWASLTHACWRASSSERHCSSIRRCGCGWPTCRRAWTSCGTASTASPRPAGSICVRRRR
jgi:hypothetical protein